MRPLWIALQIALTLTLSAKPHAVSRGVPASEVVWLRQHATTIENIVPLFANAQILALADATHGTHEFFDVKRRLIPLLVRDAGFNVVAFEASYAEWDKVRAYVASGRGDPALLIQSADYFFWDAQEVLDTIEWARAENAAGRKVDVVGVDCAHPHTAIEVVLDYLQHVDPAARTEAANRYGCLSQYAARPGNYTQVPSSLQQQCRTNVQAIHEELASRRAEYEARTSRDEFERVLHAARVVEQGELSLTTFPQNRDDCMAENIEWLTKSNPDAKVVVWGHNEHFGKTPYTLGGRTFTSTGTLLADRFGDAYRAIATTALDGSFWAYNTGWVLDQQVMTVAASDDYAMWLSAAGLREFFVAFGTSLPSWLREAHRLRIGASTAGTHEVIENLPERFDGVIYIETSTPSQLRHFPRLR